MLTILAESALRSCLLGGVVWAGLNVFRVRDPRIQMMSWVLVLVASLAMPLLIHWTTVTVTLQAPPVALPDHFAGAALPEPFAVPPAPDLGAAAVAPVAIDHAVNWRIVATAIYAIVAGLLLLRLAVGLYLTWRLVRHAGPVDESWAESWAAPVRVRVSSAIRAPVTFGSTILLPPQYVDWDCFKRDAVLAHEGAHIANRDFYLLLLAALNRAVFWFNPFAWWQVTRMAELAEIISDATALEALDDRLGYAELLLDFAQNVRAVPAALEMARACTVRARVEHILAATAAPARAGWRQRAWTAAAVLPLVVVSAGSIGFRTVPAPSPAENIAAPTTAAQRPSRIDFYAVAPGSILALSREDDRLFGQLTGQRKLLISTAADRTYSYAAAAGEISFKLDDGEAPAELALRQNDRDLPARRISSVTRDDGPADPSLLDSYVGFYQFGPIRMLSVTRDASHLVIEETGRPKSVVTALGGNAFAGAHGDLVVFLRDGRGSRVTRLLFQEATSGTRSAPRIDKARAKLVEAEFARRIAEIPDRFRDQAPTPGSRELVLHGIASMQRAAPDYDRMSAPLATRIRSLAAQWMPIFQAMGAVDSIFFRGVGPGGYDIYGVKFANGSAEFRLLVGPDGKADDVIFRPDGDDAPGGLAACAAEQSLRPRDRTAPIKVIFYNGSGNDAVLYALGPDGKRHAQGVVGDNMSASVLTTVDSPLVVADASGRCLEIVLAGQRTRRHVIETTAPDRGSPQRNAPQPGSEQMLRQYIDTLRRGEPDYDRMTHEVAVQTRQQLPFDQAILARLGALRSLSFRGVSALGSDVYMAHFANGTTEWRIGMVKEGTIGRIALGPQY